MGIAHVVGLATRLSEMRPHRRHQQHQFKFQMRYRYPLGSPKKKRWGRAYRSHCDDNFVEEGVSMIYSRSGRLLKEKALSCHAFCKGLVFLSRHWQTGDVRKDDTRLIAGIR